MNQPSVVVVIINNETKSCDKNISELRKAFADEFFQVEVFRPKIPNEFPENILNKNILIENHIFKSVLDFAANWKNLPCLIIKDSSVSNIIDPIVMRKIVKQIIDSPIGADLYYFCIWNDFCERHQMIDDYKRYSASNLVSTDSPNGNQAILYNVKTRDEIRRIINKNEIPYSDMLNLRVSKKEFKAAAFVPNIIDFDVNLATNNFDYKKLNTCNSANLTAPTEITAENGGLIILMAFLVLLTFWVIWYLYRQEKNLKK